MKYRLQLYMDTSPTELGDLARQLRTLIDSWRVGEWCYEVGDGVKSVRSVEDCGAALEENTYPWKYGDQKRVSYEPTLFVGAPEAPLVSVTYTCGVEIDLPLMPNRLVAIVDSELTADNGAALLQSWMLGAIEIFRPRFGHAGSLDIPTPVMPLTPHPKPPIGWLTYLTHAFQVPAKLPQPSVAYAAPDGVLLVAHPELFLEFKPAHRDAVRNLEAALWQT
ncbi:MAG TPA: hypothetical protein VFB62_15275 [Polyangiaceae bacterium]|jgi:hypothetical protein|nr:hypothetical protein [Polyangiaceae bacterium]